MPEEDGLLEALGWMARVPWVWPGWLLALAASLLVWHRERREAAVYLLLAGWHATLLTSVIAFADGVSWMT